MRFGHYTLKNFVTFIICRGHVSQPGDFTGIIFICLKGENIMLFVLKEKGQGLVEYAIILALIAIVVIAIMSTLGKKINNSFQLISNSLTV